MSGNLHLGGSWESVLAWARLSLSAFSFYVTKAFITDYYCNCIIIVSEDIMRGIKSNLK